MTPIISILIAGALLLSGAALAQEHQMIEYKSHDTALEGYLALPKQVQSEAVSNSGGMIPADAKGIEKVPGVLIVHQWMGLTDHEKDAANRLAEAGYAAFACDIYGRESRPSNPGEAGKYAGKYKGDVALFRERLDAGLDVLKNRPEVDPSRLAVIGYCFGGTGALELARSGADVKAVVSFHGGLATPDKTDAKNIKGTVLVCHGGDDANVPDPEMMGFIEEMRAADVDWYLTIYGNSVHGFTHRNDPKRYNRLADERSWKAMMDLFTDKMR
ncbi:dienelactone hydrolase family protein [bacterium]|nr:dienelactone hydrolase family protein [candidate division CSSED10-310 bacterium]